MARSAVAKSPETTDIEFATATKGINTSGKDATSSDALVTTSFSLLVVMHLLLDK